MDTVVNRIHSGRAHIIAKESHKYSTYFNIHEATAAAAATAADQCYNMNSNNNNTNSKKGVSDKVSPHQNDQNESTHRLHQQATKHLHNCGDATHFGSPDVSPEVSEMLKCLHLLQDIKDKLTREQTKDLEKEYQKFIKEEWRYLARVVDRLLGLLYVLLFVTLIVAFS